MKTNENAHTSGEVEFLVFKLMENLIGLDSEHIARLMGLDDARSEEADMQWLHEKLSFGNREVNYSDPRVVFARDGAATNGLVIDSPRDFVTVPVSSIRPLPAIIEKCEGAKPFWGAFVMGDEIVLLADIFELLNSKSKCA